MRSRLVHLLLATGFAGALAVSVSAGMAYACRCGIAAPEGNLATADLAFEGTVLSVAIPPSVPGRDTSHDPLAVTFAVERILKWTPGGPGERITVSTPNNSRACGVIFSPGEHWRIYATLPVPGGNPQTTSCSGDELMGRGGVPVPSAGSLLTLLIAATLVLALVAFLAWVFMRRPRGESA